MLPAKHRGLSRLQAPLPCLLTRCASFSAALMLVTLRMPKAMEYESMEDSGKGRASALPCTHCSDWASAGRGEGSCSAAHMSYCLPASQPRVKRSPSPLSLARRCPSPNISALMSQTVTQLCRQISPRESRCLRHYWSHTGSCGPDQCRQHLAGKPVAGTQCCATMLQRRRCSKPHCIVGLVRHVLRSLCITVSGHIMQPGNAVSSAQQAQPQS